MQTTNYRLLTQIEHIKSDNPEWFKHYIRQVLESDKPYYAKADYIGLSLQELQNKIDYLSEDIQEMQLYKKRLTAAKERALEVSASVLAEYGIDRLDGALISSLTIIPARTKLSEKFHITDADALIKLGYFKVTVDEEAVKEAMQSLELMDLIDPYVLIDVTSQAIPAKLKVNSKRVHTTQADELLVLAENAA